MNNDRIIAILFSYGDIYPTSSDEFIEFKHPDIAGKGYRGTPYRMMCELKDILMETIQDIEREVP